MNSDMSFIFDKKKFDAKYAKSEFIIWEFKLNLSQIKLCFVKLRGKVGSSNNLFVGQFIQANFYFR
jgi:hypothetical protein